MVAVEYPDLSGEAENAENPNQLSGVPRGARPAGESADQVQARDMSFDVDTDDLNQVAYENREAVNIAAENFRRFTNGLKDALRNSGFFGTIVPCKTQQLRLSPSPGRRAGHGSLRRR
jgi:hypothetical protein